jgi:hypothetical protein
MQTLAEHAALPSSSAIREEANRVLSRPYYDLGITPRSNETPFWLRVIEWLMAPFRLLYDVLAGLPEFARWTIVILSILVCIALVAHIVYSIVVAIRGPTTLRRTKYTPLQFELDPVNLELEAEKASVRGAYIDAIRLLFRAALRRIERVEKKKLRPGFTNREILRRYRSASFAGALQQFVDVLEQKWYGGGICDREDFLICSGAHARIRDYAQEPRPTVDT